MFIHKKIIKYTTKQTKQNKQTVAESFLHLVTRESAPDCLSGSPSFAADGSDDPLHRSCTSTPPEICVCLSPSSNSLSSSLLVFQGPAQGSPLAHSQLASLRKVDPRLKVL